MRSIANAPLLIRLGLLVAVLVGAGGGYLLLRAEPEPADRPVLVPPPPDVDPALIVDLLERDAIQSIDDPRFESVEAAQAGMRPDERVIGLVINGDARAYPIPILSVHEIVNDVVGGEPVAVTWCPLCYTALVFSRALDGREEPLHFGVSGALLYETLVMFDRDTNSRWSQLYGAAIDGPLANRRLAFFSSVNTQWSAWRAEHPDGLVLSKTETCAQFQCGNDTDNPLLSYSIDPYESYYARRDEGVINRQLVQDEFERGPKDRLLGLRAAGGVRAYPYDILREEAVINDVLNGLPVLVWFDPATETGSAFVRRAADLTLTFRADPNDPRFIIDGETGSRWRASTGQAVEGKLDGTALPRLVVTVAFEFGWFNYFPESETYRSDQ